MKKTYSFPSTAIIKYDGKELRVPVFYETEAETEQEAKNNAFNAFKNASLGWNYGEPIENGKPIKEPFECDFYSIEEDPNTGQKFIHIFGYLYKGDIGYKNIEATFCTMFLSEFVERYRKQGQEVVNEMLETVKQYEGDDACDAVKTFNGYFNGKPPKCELHYSNITNETPCGNYYSKF